MDELFKKLHEARGPVLLLEDDNAVRRSLQLLLEGRGFHVKAYASADALLADPLVAKADCVLIDYCLGSLDGIAVLHKLRTLDWAGPAILMTAFGSDELTARAKAAGFMEVLDKPFRDHAIVAALLRASQR